MAGKKHFDFFEYARHENGRFITLTDCIDGFTMIRGLAARGTLESDAGWLLERTIIVGGVISEVEYADDAQFTQVWNDRLLSFGPPAAGSSAGVGDTNFCIPASRILDSEGKPIDTSNPLDVTAEVTQGGLFTDMQVTKVSVGTTAVSLPTTALTSRNTISIFNQDAVDTLFIDDNAGVTTSGATEGWEVLPQSSFTVDITEAIGLFGISTNAGGISIKVLELS